MNEQYVMIDGLRIRFLVNGSGPPLLLVHGLGEFAEMWSSNISELGEHFTVYAVDLPGNGMSQETNQNYDFDFCVKFITDFMEALEIPSTCLAGRSLGASISLQLAIDFPDKVNNLVLVSMGGFTSKMPLSYRLTTLPLLGHILLGPTLLVGKTTVKFGMRRQFYNPETVPEEWITNAVKYLRMPKRNNTIRSFIKSITKVSDGQTKVSIIDKLRFLQIPALMIHGRQDKVIPIEHAHNNVGLLPNTRLEIFEQCAHNPQIEKAPQFNKMLLDFLKPNEHEFQETESH